MATRNEDLRYRLLGEDVSAGRTFSKVGNAARSAHSAISELGQTLNSTGAFEPFVQGLDAISQGFEHVKENGKSTRVVMQGIGIGIAAAGAALLGLGANAQQATAGLKQAVQNAGGVYEEYAKAIEATVNKTATFGRTAGDTENALARLVTATGDPQRALSLMGLTANIAAARNMNLTDSAQLLTTALAGNTRVFRQFGINVGTGKLSAEQLSKALDELNRRLSGRAQAQADTFSGRIKAMGVEFENAFESMTKFAPLLIAVGTSVTAATAAWDLLARAKARNAEADAANVISSGRVAKAEVAAAAEAAGASGVGALGAAGASRFTRGNLFKAGGLAAGGLLTGQLAASMFGNGTGGSMASDALSLGGTGAGIGTLIEPGLGTLIGGGVGAAGGALLGLFHHGSGKAAKLQAFQKQLVAETTSQQDQTAMDSFMFAEFDPTGSPKASKLAAANEALAKAKTRLARAQEDLNKQTSKGTDPLKLEAATAHLASAEANLRKAQYVGGDARIASAQSSVAAAEARINALHAGTDSTAAARRVTDARQAVADARRTATAARLGIAGPSASQFLASLTGQSQNKQRAANDVGRLVDTFHVGGPLLKQIEAQGDATVHHIAITMTQGLARQFNQRGAEMEQAAKDWQAANNRAFTTAAAALGKQMADAQMAAYAARITKQGLPNGGGPFNMGAPYNVSPKGGLAGIYIQNMTVPANDPHKLAHDLAAKTRHKALSGQTPIAG